MPQLFKIGPYSIYFWSNESNPLETVHVHISEGRATANATKIWITSRGKALRCNNNSAIPEHIFTRMERYLEANSEYIIHVWKNQFGKVEYYI